VFTSWEMLAGGKARLLRRKEGREKDLEKNGLHASIKIRHAHIRAKLFKSGKGYRERSRDMQCEEVNAVDR